MSEKIREQSQSPETIFKDSIDTWRLLVSDADILEEDRNRLNLILGSLNLNTFLDKRLFWQEADKMASLSMVTNFQRRDIGVLADQILGDMVKAFQKISGESPAIKA